MTISTMPTAGVLWVEHPDSAALIPSGPNAGYRYNTSIWNLAWNVLKAQGNHDEHNLGDVTTEMDTISHYALADHKLGISNPNVVTKEQLGTLAQHFVQAPKTSTGGGGTSSKFQATVDGRFGTRHKRRAGVVARAGGTRPLAAFAWDIHIRGHRRWRGFVAAAFRPASVEECWMA